MDQWREYDELQLTPVLRGALAAFREHGYHGASVRDIASRVGVTVPGLYYHHRNKEAMLAALIDISIHAVVERVRLAMAAAGDDLRTQLANTIEAVVLHMTYHADFAFLDPEFRFLKEETSHSYAEARRAVERRIADLLAVGVETGVFTAEIPDGTARALVGMCQSVAFWYRSDGPKSPREIAREYAAIALSIVDHELDSPRLKI
ncbi:TetR family transcriptional regulator [Antricoccus suffuscus]|uniref:TetR family transcriptional regulator n=1 Tax=Antricoccus suffuscus TaxID=1629062 RepID=A0A2T1A2T3_9ACTN|nr:TetR/AcrR family transcriptional regulator [Antricoccus suffuscus]PRZ42844.1 TetR family transcriptional regulator [Antricoccus suffuscus]